MIDYYIRKRGKRDIDILITEGTMLSRMNEKVFTEAELQAWAKEYFKSNKYVFLICSSTNLDTLSSFYHAAIDNGMSMYGNSYIYRQLKTFTETAGKKSRLYKFDRMWPIDFDKHLEKNGFSGTQEEFMRKYGFVCVVKEGSKYEKWIERFNDLNPVVIYSMWDGYRDKERTAYNQKLDEFCNKFNTISKHTSGHATANVIAKVIEAVDPKEAIIPIHTEHPEMIRELNIRDELKEKVVYYGK